MNADLMDIMMLLFSLLVSFAFAGDYASTGSVENGFVGGVDGQQIEVSILSQDAARDLFHEFASQPQIPFKYPIDRCYARATEMDRLAEAKGMKFARVYAEGMLRVQTPLRKYPMVEWGWHVAPIAYVSSPDGSRKVMVFDPSLFSKPVTVDEWKSKMLADGDPPARIDQSYFGSRFQYFPRFTESNRSDWSQDVLTGTKTTMQSYKAFEDNSGASTRQIQKLPDRVTQ